MSRENDNNIANYEEIESHCKLLGAKLSKVTDQHGKGMTNTLEDLIDYYERGIQLRIMRIETLEQLLKEQKEQIEQASLQQKLLLVSIFVVFGVNTILKHPKEAFAFLKQTWTYIAVILATVTIFNRGH